MIPIECYPRTKRVQSCLFLFPDKQQDLDIPQVNSEQNDKSAEKTSPMTKIIGVRKLKHTNSYTTVPKYGVETRHPDELGKVWGQGSKGGGLLKIVVKIQQLYQFSMILKMRGELFKEASLE